MLRHLDGCDLARHNSIHDTCDSLVEDCVPPDVLAPIRAYADSLLRPTNG